MFKVKLNTANEAALFASKCCTYNFDIDYRGGRFIVDAKSFMGIVAVGIGNLCTIEPHTKDEEQIKRLYEDIKVWVVSDDE